jgi:hypothetical protein
VVLLNGVTVIVKAAHVRLCHSRMLFVRAYPRETQEMVSDTRPCLQSATPARIEWALLNSVGKGPQTDFHEAESATKRARDRAVATDLKLYLPATDERLTQTSCPMHP